MDGGGHKRFRQMVAAFGGKIWLLAVLGAMQAVALSGVQPLQRAVLDLAAQYPQACMVEKSAQAPCIDEANLSAFHPFTTLAAWVRVRPIADTAGRQPSSAATSARLQECSMGGPFRAGPLAVDRGLSEPGIVPAAS